jgi:hypothetical protein
VQFVLDAPVLTNGAVQTRRIGLETADVVVAGFGLGKRLRFLIFNTAGRLLRHARSLVLRLAATAEAITLWLLGGIQTVEATNRFLREHYIAEFNGRFQVAPAQRGSAFVACPRSKDLDLILALQFGRMVNRDNTVSFQNLTLQIEPVKWRGILAGLQCDSPSASGWNDQPHPRAAPVRTLYRPRCGHY